jgi:hypothetical protein
MAVRRDRFRCLIRAGLIGMLSTGCASFPRAADEGGHPWVQVDTPHFSLATDMDAGPARDVARTLEDWWAVMGIALPQAGGGSDAGRAGRDRLLVIALRSRGEREEVHYNLGGAFSVFPLVPPAMSIGNFDDDLGRNTLKHELAHALLYERLPRVPRWFTEGMAVYLQTADLNRERGMAVWGRRSESETHAMVEWRALGTRTLLDPDSWRGDDTFTLEFYAGLLVHMLINRHPDQLACYLQRLEADLDTEAALQCFPERARWDFEITDYAYSLSFASKEAPLVVSDADATTSSMADAQVHAVLALLDFIVMPHVLERFRPPREARARHNLERASSLDRAHLLAGLLTLSRTDLRPQARAELTKTLVDGHPDDWRAWVARAEVDNLPIAEWQHAVARARELAPGQQSVLRLVALAALVERRWDEARALATNAWLRGADDVIDRVVPFIATEQLGRCTEASVWLPPAAKNEAFGQKLADVRKMLDLPAASCVPAVPAGLK